jgi:hypothetical protein
MSTETIFSEQQVLHKRVFYIKMSDSFTSS